MTRRVVGLVVVACVVCVAVDLQAYLKLGYPVAGRIVALRWPNSVVRYAVTNRAVTGVSVDALQDRVAAGFAAWARVTDASVAAEFAGVVSADPGAEDGITVIGFRSRPDLDRVLGATTFAVDDRTGDLLEADIFLNAAFPWSAADGGETGRYDVQSIATHEIGHLLGLSHSALGETTLSGGGRTVQAKGAVMFPIAYPPGNLRDRDLAPDDAAGLADIYGTIDARATLGSISGRVTRNGTGVFGAHVVAFNPATGASVGGFTLTADGRFVIGSLPRGLYVVRAEPIDDAEVGSFFDNSSSVVVGFVPAFAPGLVAVPEGGSASAPEIQVTAK